MTRRNSLALSLALAWVALAAAPSLGAGFAYPVTIGVEVDNKGCIEFDPNDPTKPLITARPWFLFVAGEDHPAFFAGTSNSDAPTIAWQVQTSTGIPSKYLWEIRRKADQRLFFQGGSMEPGKLYTATNGGKEVDAWGPPFGIDWRYSITAKWKDAANNPDNCPLLATLDPGVRFKRKGKAGFLFTFLPWAFGLLAALFLVYTWAKGRRRLRP